MQLLEVLRALIADRRDLRLAAFSARRIDWALASGLGPAMFRAVGADLSAPEAPGWTELEAADLTARVLAAHQTSALLEVIDACRHHDIPIAVLKGMAVSEEYPLPYLRPMRDIDVLVPAHLVSATLEVCRQLGYVDDPSAAPGAYDRHHHAAPLVHKSTGIWLEIHHRLFPTEAQPTGSDPFALDRVAALTVTWDVHGRPVGRLSPELEVPYLASHWARSGKPIAEPGGVMGLLDIVMLSKRMTAQDWSLAYGNVEGSAAAHHLQVVLGYLAERRLLLGEGPVHEARRNALLPYTERLAHAIIDRHIIDGWRPGGRLALRVVARFWDQVLRPPESDAA